MPYRASFSPHAVDLLIMEHIAPDLPAFADIRTTYTDYQGRSNISKPHVHQMLEVGYIHEGRATLMIADKHLDYVAGDLCIITPFEPHQAFFPVTCVCSWMYFDVPRMLAHFAGETSLISLDPFQGPGFVNVLHQSKHGEIVEIARHMIEELERKPAFYKDSLRSLLLTLLVRLHRMSSDGVCSAAKNEKRKTPMYGSVARISPAITYMHEHYGDSVSMEELASSVFMSVSNFRREFIRCIGCPPYEYLTMFRVAAAQAQLMEGTKRVEQIAFDCGFSVPSAFRRAFKKRTGQSPISVRMAGRNERKTRPLA